MIMSVLKSIWNEIIGFFGITRFLDILKDQDYATFLTYDGIVALILPIVPLLIFLELFWVLHIKNRKQKFIKLFF